MSSSAVGSSATNRRAIGSEYVGERCPLLLTPGQLRGRVVDAIRDAQDIEQLRGTDRRRDYGVSPWRVHFTMLELRDDVFVVIGTEDREGVVDLPPVWGTCP